MTPEDRTALVRYRRDQAEHALRQADALAAIQEWDGVVNRAYYAMFYAAEAALTTLGLSAHKHAGVLVLADRDLVGRGVLTREDAARLRQAYRLRQRSDYTATAPIEPDRAGQLLEAARSFVTAVTDALDHLPSAERPEAPSEPEVPRSGRRQPELAAR